MIASIHFGKNKTLFSIIEKTDVAFCLHYLNSLENTIDLNDLYSETAANFISEFSTIVEKYKTDISSFFVAIDTEYSIITKVPGNIDLQSSEFVDLINLEIKQNYPDKSIDDFRIKTTEIISTVSQNNMYLAVIISNELIYSIENMMANFEIKVTDINASQFSAINTLLYNYPDVSCATNIIVNINGDLLEYAIIGNRKIIGYEFNLLDENTDISSVIESKISSIVRDIGIEDLDGIYFFGQDLEKARYLKCWEAGMLIGKEAKRLNPFRLFKTDFEKRDFEYCARTFHTYAVCIGGALPIQFPVVVR